MTDLKYFLDLIFTDYNDDAFLLIFILKITETFIKSLFIGINLKTSLIGKMSQIYLKLSN